MPELFELRLEVPFVAPANPDTVISRLKEAMRQAADESGLEKVVVEGTLEPTFGQELPDKEGVTFIIAVVAFAIQVGELAWPYVKKWWRKLQGRLSNAAPGQQVTAVVRIGDREVPVDNFTSGEDAIAFLTEEYEVLFRPRS